MTYNTLTDASKQSGAHVQRISNCCKKLIPNVGFYQFTFEGDEEPGVCENPIFAHKPVCQKDLAGNIIAMYLNANDAAKEVNVDSSCIRRCCYGDKKTCKGYIWEFIPVMEYGKYMQIA